MKISVKDGGRVAMFSRVWVDGVEVSDRCFEADDEAGYALCYIYGERTEEEKAAGVSNVKMNEDRTELLIERLEGNVRIERGE